jgi:predicted nucleotidyltransferase
MTLASGIEVPAARIAEICKRYGIKEMSIFGSAARGDMHADSDVDVMVEFLPDVVHGWEYFRLERELAEVFGRPVDLATKKWMKPRVKARVLPEAHLVYAA